jgi:hypothetical protein
MNFLLAYIFGRVASHQINKELDENGFEIGHVNWFKALLYVALVYFGLAMFFLAIVPVMIKLIFSH